jgi:tetratricopeptide (TPR) repeat protein
LGKKPSLQPPDVARTYNGLAEVYRFQAQYAAAEPLYLRALGAWEKTLGPEHPDLTLGLDNLAKLYRATNREAEALELEKRANHIKAKIP